MGSRRWSAAVGVMVVAPGLVTCRPRVARETAPEVTSCEGEVGSVEGIVGARWEAWLGVDASEGARIRGGLRVALGLKQLATVIDGRLRDACNGLARDLGGRESESVQGACSSAAEAVRKVRREMGDHSTSTVEREPMRCSSRMDVLGTCVGECEAPGAGRSVEVRCEGGETAGECSGQCVGACDLTGGGRCEGECRGSCDAEMEGVCDGKCAGKCPRVSREELWCLGVCQGRCQGTMKGTCRGSCKGGCQLTAGGSCPGLCWGTCSSALKAPRCTGKLSPQEASVSCATACEAQSLAAVTCSSPEVRLRVDGSSDAAASTRFKAATEKHLGALLTIAVGMKPRLDGLAERGQAVLGSTGEVASPAADDTPERSRATRCIQSSLPGAFEAVESLRTDVRVAADLARQLTAAR